MAITNTALWPIQINTLSLTQIIQWWNWSRISLYLIACIEMAGAVVPCHFSKTEYSGLILVYFIEEVDVFHLCLLKLSSPNCQLCILLSSLQALLPFYDTLSLSPPPVCSCRMSHGALHPAVHHHAWQAAHPEQPVWDWHTVSAEHTLCNMQKRHPFPWY